MQCPHCGAQVIPGNRFCQQCRKRVVPPSEAFPPSGSSPSRTSPPAAPTPTPGPGFAGSSILAAAGVSRVEIRRPGIVTLLAVLDLLGGGGLLLMASLVALGAIGSKGGVEGGVMLALGAVYGAVGAVQIAAGIGMWQLQSWGRFLQIGLACIGLLGIPCGTLISILILIYLMKPGVKVLFSGRTADELTPEEAAEVGKVLQASGATAVLVAVVVILGGVALIGIVAAIAIPSLLRARISANESAAIGRLRSVIAAEGAYSQMNSGYGDRPQCLAAPAGCLPASAGAKGPFLDGSILFDTAQTGYVMRFHPGATAPPAALAGGGVSPTSLTTFAVVAVPLTAGQTGMRSFCGDASGRICAVKGGLEPAAQEGMCPANCEDLP